MMIVSADYIQHTKYGALPENSYIYKDFSYTTKLFVDSTLIVKDQTASLKKAQAELSTEITKLSQNTIEKINPRNITLHYINIKDIPNEYGYTMWQGIVDMIVAAYKVTYLEIDNTNETTDQGAYYVITNSLKEILINTENSNIAIVDDVSEKKDTLNKINISLDRKSVV